MTPFDHLRQLFTNWAGRVVRWSRIASADSNGRADVEGRTMPGGLLGSDADLSAIRIYSGDPFVRTAAVVDDEDAVDTVARERAADARREQPSALGRAPFVQRLRIRADGDAQRPRRYPGASHPI